MLLNSAGAGDGLLLALPIGGRRARKTPDEQQAEAEQLEGMVSGVRKQLQLSGLCEYVDVRARDHVNMKYAALLLRRSMPHLRLHYCSSNCSSRYVPSDQYIIL